jgi:hypothetical protein
MLIRITAWLLVIGVTIGSLQPARPRLVRTYHDPIHVLAFGAIAFLFFRVSPNRRRRLLRALAIFLLGLSLEFFQHIFYRGPMEWLDVCADGASILISLALCDLIWTPSGKAD